MKKKPYKKFRIPLPKQNNQVFKSVRDYDRKREQKGWRKDAGLSFSLDI